MKVFKTEVFQGNLKKNHYFEGWYFKHVSFDTNSVYAFIPGVSLTGNNSHSFIQIMNGITGETHYITYNLNDFKWNKDQLFVQVGSSIFTDKYVDMNIEDEKISIKGRIEYSEIVKYPKSLMSPSIMGWYSYIPFMECNHGIVNVNHSLNGKLIINKKEIDFSNGRGYIEKDWGKSFPESWIWLHSNSFKLNNTSLFVSIAKIPWLGHYFIGFICFLHVNGTFYRFSTYNNSKISKVSYDGNKLSVQLESKKYILKVIATPQSLGVLRAPSLGKMTRHIKESIDSTVHVRLFDKSKGLIFEDYGKRAGLEIIEKIFEYFQ